VEEEAEAAIEEDADITDWKIELGMGDNRKDGR
jgi:hypothetical protein